MRIRARTSRSALWAALIIAAVVSAGCGGVTLLLGGVQSSGDSSYDYSYYHYDPFTYYDEYWYDYDEYSFIDYIDGWYYDTYSKCDNCKTIDDFDTGSLKKPVGWDSRWGPWKEFVRARVEFLLTKPAQDRSNTKVLPDK